jgi:RimJ/RimL family protein N-acetyltransferase
MSAPELRTERLLLRGWREADRAPFAALNADPAVVEHLAGPIDRTASDAFADRIAAHWATYGWGLWAVEVPNVAPFIGYVGLWPLPLDLDPPIEIGWRLAAAHWGRGYATEAARACLAVAFESLDLPRLHSITVPQNRRSIAVMERIGMTRVPDGDFDHPRVDPATHPHLVRHVLYRRTREAWLAARRPPTTRPAS